MNRGLILTGWLLVGMALGTAWHADPPADGLTLVSLLLATLGALFITAGRGGGPRGA